MAYYQTCTIYHNRKVPLSKNVLLGASLLSTNMENYMNLNLTNNLFWVKFNLKVKLQITR